MKSPWTILGLCACLGLPLQAQEAAAPGPDPQAVVGGTLVEATSEPSTFNLYASTEGTTRVYMREILEPLFSVSEQEPGALVPRLAVRWVADEDGRTFVFHLRSGVTWSDGAPFTADDVLFTFQAMSTPELEYSPSRDAFATVESMTKVDDLTVRVRMHRAYWKALYVVGYQLYVLPRHWYLRRVAEVAAQAGIRPAPAAPGDIGFGRCFQRIDEPCIGTGPYKLAAGGWVRGQSLTLERNPTHWRHAVEPGVCNIQVKRVRFIGDQRAITDQLRAQRIDIAAVKLDEWQDSLSRDPAIRDNYTLHQYEHVGLGYNAIVWNCRAFPFDDRRVRVAMTQLIDREGMLRDLWRGVGRVASCASNPVLPGYDHDLAPWPFDPQAAGELLTGAGFVDVDGDGVREKHVDGRWRRFEFTLDVPAGIREYEAIGERVRESLAAAGVRMRLRATEWATFVRRLDDLDFQAACLYYSMSDPWPDPYESYHSSEAGRGDGNTAGLQSDELDRLLEAAQVELDTGKRHALFRQIHGRVHQEQPMTLLIHGRVNVLIHKRFRNVVIRHLGARSTYWWVDPEVASPNEPR